MLRSALSGTPVQAIKGNDGPRGEKLYSRFFLSHNFIKMNYVVYFFFFFFSDEVVTHEYSFSKTKMHHLIWYLSF